MLEILMIGKENPIRKLYEKIICELENEANQKRKIKTYGKIIPQIIYNFGLSIE
jgi:hypothetical protein